MSIHKSIQLGLCCMNTELRNLKPPIYASRSITQKKVLEIGQQEGVKIIKERAYQNILDIIKLMEWNEENGIKVFRLSSEILPHKSNIKVDNYDFDFILDKLKEIGRLSKKYNQRLTFHPGQFNIIGAKEDKIFQATIRELSYHADLFDLMELDQNSVIVIHGGGVYGNKKETMERWYDNFNRLPEKIKKRLVIENCERMYNIEDCLEISKRINIPVVFDTHHHQCYQQLHPEFNLKPVEEYIPLILDTWKRRNIKPKFHVSEQGSGRVGHHSDFVETIPEYLLSIPQKYGVDIDIMIEAKMKEQAIFKLYQKYPFLNCKENKLNDVKDKHINIYHDKIVKIKIKKKINEIDKLKNMFDNFTKIKKCSCCD